MFTEIWPWARHNRCFLFLTHPQNPRINAMIIFLLPMRTLSTGWISSSSNTTKEAIAQVRVRSQAARLQRVCSWHCEATCHSTMRNKYWLRASSQLAAALDVVHVLAHFSSREFCNMGLIPTVGKGKPRPDPWMVTECGWTQGWVLSMMRTFRDNCFENWVLAKYRSYLTWFQRSQSTVSTLGFSLPQIPFIWIKVNLVFSTFIIQEKKKTI